MNNVLGWTERDGGFEISGRDGTVMLMIAFSHCYQMVFLKSTMWSQNGKQATTSVSREEGKRNNTCAAVPARKGNGTHELWYAIPCDITCNEIIPGP